QMLTGTMPYNTPSPADLERLKRGDLLTNPRARNPKIPQGLSAVVMKAMARAVTGRYQRASELLDAVLAIRATPRRPRSTPTPPAESLGDVHSRLKARGPPQPRLLW